MERTIHELKKEGGKEEKILEKKHFSVLLKDENGILPFSMKKGSVAERMGGIDSSEKSLELFTRLLEKAMRDVIWYIGTDILGENYYERFMFNKSGFLEIALGEKAEIRAYFPNNKRADRFRAALKKALIKLLGKKASHLIKDIK